MVFDTVEREQVWLLIRLVVTVVSAAGSLLYLIEKRDDIVGGRSYQRPP